MRRRERNESFAPACAASRASFVCRLPFGFLGLASMPITVASGTSSWSNSNRFAPSAGLNTVTPVRLPVVRAMKPQRQSNEAAARHMRCTYKVVRITPESGHR
jgi:hypothetical protein